MAKNARRALRFAGPQTEAGVTPGAGDGLDADASLRQRPMVVRAVRADGEDFIAAADKQDLFATGTAHELAAIREVGDWDALGYRSGL